MSEWKKMPNRTKLAMAEMIKCAMSNLPDNPSESFKRRNPHLYPPNLRQNRSETHQNDPDHTKTPPKQSKRLKHEDSTDCVLQDPKPERDQKAALGYANAGKVQSVQRVKVRIVGLRARPLDCDNYAGSTKDMLDGLRHAGLIPDDAPWAITLQTEQVKVAHRKDECTIIEIEYP